MKYQSELIKEMIDSRGHEKSSIHYQSDCVETWIEEAKGAYPKLCDYESEWLNYIVQNPIGEFPYETVTDVTEATVNNVVPFAYKSAILKGNTGYRDIDTGEFLETFEEGRNLELVSVKMPVLTTLGKNLFDKTKIIFNKLIDLNTGNIVDDSATNTSDFIKVIPNTQYTMSFNFETIAWTRAWGFADVNGASDKCYFDSPSKTITFTTSPTTKYLLFSFGKGVEESFQLEQGSTATSYEPYKSNILSTSEDVELRGIGDVKDKLNLMTGELTQRIGEIVLDGSENWVEASTMPDGFYKARVDLQDRGDNFSFGSFKVLLISDRFISYPSRTVPTNHGNYIVRPDHSVYVIDLIISDADIQTHSLQAFKQYLQDNPTTVQYRLATESVKTVDLIVTNQDGETLNKLKPIEGTMHLSTSSKTIEPLFSGEIPVEAITQNLTSFIGEE